MAKSSATDWGTNDELATSIEIGSSAEGRREDWRCRWHPPFRWAEPGWVAGTDGRASAESPPKGICGRPSFGHRELATIVTTSAGRLVGRSDGAASPG